MQNNGNQPSDEAQAAYAVAEQMIAEALVSGTQWLSFSNRKTYALTKIPPEISKLTHLTELDLGVTEVSDISALKGMTAMTSLDLEGTQVSDISVLQGMTAMTFLDIRGTQVSDLAPIATLTSLIPQEGARPWDGLFYSDTPATAQDTVLKELSRIEVNRERTEKTLAYLRGEGRGGTADAVPPKDNPAAPAYILPPDAPMHSDPEPPEGGDEDQQALLEEVREKVQVMLDEIGGHNEPVVVRLKDSALKYQRQVAKPIDKISLRLLWSAANSLRQAYHADDRASESARINDELPPRIASALRDLVETHGLFIMGFENAAALEAQMRGFTEGPRDKALRKAAQDIVAVLQNRDGALAVDDFEALEEDALTADANGPDGAMAEASLIGRLWNMLGAAGRAVAVLAKKGAVGGATVLLSHDFIQLLLGNETLIWKFLQAAQGEWAVWFPRLMEIIKAMLGG